MPPIMRPEEYGPAVAEWLAQRRRFSDDAERDKRRRGAAGGIALFLTQAPERPRLVVDGAGNDPPVIQPAIPGGFEHVKDTRSPELEFQHYDAIDPPFNGEYPGNTGDAIRHIYNTASALRADKFANAYIETHWLAYQGAWTEDTSIRGTSPGAGGSILTAILQWVGDESFTDATLEVCALNQSSQFNQAAVIRGQDFVGVFSGYAVLHDALGVLTLYRFDLDAETPLTSDLGALAEGDEWGVSAVGDQISITRNGSAVATVTDATYTAGFAAIASGSLNRRFNLARITV